MFNYIKFAGLTTVMCDAQMIRYAASWRLPVNVKKYLEENDVDVTGCMEFYAKDGENIRIFIVYGITDCAMMHDIIDGIHTFCIFADYIAADATQDMEMYHMLYDILDSIMSYSFYPLRKKESKYIKDTFRSSVKHQAKYICIYNVWKIFGDSFLEEYVTKRSYTGETVDELRKIIELYDDFK